MKRWSNIPSVLTLAVAIAIVCYPRSPEPAEPDTPTDEDNLAAPFPETVALRSWAKRSSPGKSPPASGRSWRLRRCSGS
jgi:hypothetical protein